MFNYFSVSGDSKQKKNVHKNGTGERGGGQATLWWAQLKSTTFFLTPPLTEMPLHLKSNTDPVFQKQKLTQCNFLLHLRLLPQCKKFCIAKYFFTQECIFNSRFWNMITCTLNILVMLHAFYVQDVQNKFFDLKNSTKMSEYNKKKIKN